ncbi:MAG: class III cytochrome c [Desulfobulbus propionicus]|nr:MAG: class III cytochrome c [Desulfobulbus propionicus]
MKKLVMIMACIIGLVDAATGTDNGPAEMILESTINRSPTPKQAIFPHGAHQGMLPCRECHHGKDSDGIQIPYTDGQKIEKCESCHNTGNTQMVKKLNTFKKAAHAKCKACHFRTDKKVLGRCTTCHPKKK